MASNGTDRPNRRETLAGVGASVLASLAPGGLAAQAIGSAARQNVLLVTLDDAQWQTMGLFGQGVPGATPNLQAFAKTAVTYRHAHSTIAECWPFRAAMMTARYPHRNGAHHFYPVMASLPTLSGTLRQAGYFTALMGKERHTIPHRHASDFDLVVGDHELMNGRSPSDFAARLRQAIQQAQGAGRPFFVNLNSHDPHRPFPGSDDWDNVKAYIQYATDSLGLDTLLYSDRLRYQGNYPPAPRTFAPAEVTVPGFVPDLPGVRQDVAEYYTALHRADATVGAALGVLDALGVREQTIVVVLSDHGMSIPFAKTCVYQNSTLCSLMVAVPGVPGGRVDRETLIESIDLAPTLLELLGLPPFPYADGRSFRTALAAPRPQHRAYAATYIHSVFGGDFPMRAINDRAYGYIFNAWSDGRRRFMSDSIKTMTFAAMQKAAATDPAVKARVQLYLYRQPEEFYHYADDPNGLVDLSGVAAERDRLAHYRGLLLEHMRATDDPLLGVFEAFSA